MTDTNDDLQPQDLEQQENVEYTDIELAAMEEGWKPRDQYEGDPAKWRSAELFMTLKPFYEKIESLSKTNKQNQKHFQQIAKDMQLVRAQAYEKAVADLKAARKDAQYDGNFDQVDLINDQLENLKEARRLQEQQVVQQEPQVNHEFEAWQSRNTWYNRDEDLRDWADARGIRLHQNGMSPDEVLAKLEQEVKQKFPEKFVNPARGRAAAVSSGVPNKRPAKADTSGMSPEEKRIMDTIVRSGVISAEDYLKQYNGSK